MTSMQEIETGNFAGPRWVLCPPSSIRVVNWQTLIVACNSNVLSSSWPGKGRYHPAAGSRSQRPADAPPRHRAANIAETAAELCVWARVPVVKPGSRGSPAYHGQATLSLAIIEFADPQIPEAVGISGARAGFFRKSIHFKKESEDAWRWSARQTSRKIVTYNLHLESKGDDGLRGSQLEETLEDARRYSSVTPILLAGDFNLDVTGGLAAAGISRAHFQDALANHHVATTPDSFLQDGRIIDWIFTRGPIRVGQSEVHRSVSASDHYPISITLAFA